jgi:hypothetical protein
MPLISHVETNGATATDLVVTYSETQRPNRRGIMEELEA